jgi:hypothetical protein
MLADYMTKPVGTMFFSLLEASHEHQSVLASLEAVVNKPEGKSKGTNSKVKIYNDQGHL